MIQQSTGESLDGSGPTANLDLTADFSGKTSGPVIQQRNRRLSLAVCVFLALAVWIVFGQTLHHDFINYDDPAYVTQTPAISQGISWYGVTWAFTHRHSDNWHPLTSLSHMLDCQFYGLNPGGHHLTNVLLHTATVIFLFLVLQNMTGVLWPAALVAAVFAIHPLRVESVAWIAERKDVLSGLFFMLTLWAYVRHAKKPESGNLGIFSFLQSSGYWLALVFYACGLMSKPMLVTMPFVLLLADYWPLNRWAGRGADALSFPRQSWLRLSLEKLPFLLLTVTSCTVTIWAQQNAITVVQETNFAWRMGNALVAYVTYIGQMFYPFGLAVFYPHPGSQQSVWMMGAAGLILFAITAGVLIGRRRHPYLLVGWLWYLGMLVPVIGLMQVGGQARADRYTYLPQIGLYFLMVWGVTDLCRHWRHRRAVLGLVTPGIIFYLLVGAYVQTTYWKNSLSLWTRTLECVPENAIARCNLGLVLATQEKWDEAIYHYECALQLKPEYSDAHNNLGVALSACRKWNEAVAHYEHALRINPNLPDTCFNLGNALAQQKRWNEAIPHYKRALHLAPDLADAHINLGSALTANKQWAEAIQHFKLAGC